MITSADAWRSDTAKAIASLLGDRIQINSILIVCCFVSVLLLSSQSAASYPSYLLALSLLVTVHRWNDVFAVRFFWGVLGLLTYLTSSALWSTPFETRDLVSVATRAFLVLSLVIAVGECSLRGLVRLWLGRALACVGLCAVVAAIVVFHVTDPADGRLNGLGQLDTHVIAALVFGVVMIFAMDILATDRSMGWRLLGALAAPIVLYAVYLSDSRNAWISVLLGAGVFWLARWVRDRDRFVVSICAMVIVAIALIGALLLDDNTRQWLLPRGDSFRLTIWPAILERLMEQNLWVGLGINTADNVTAGDIEFLHPHNMYLAVAFQGGVIGLAWFLIVVAWTISLLLKNYAEADAKLALGILGVTLPAYLLDGHELVDKVGATWFLFWLPVGISLAFAWRQRPR